MPKRTPGKKPAGRPLQLWADGSVRADQLEGELAKAGFSVTRIKDDGFPEPVASIITGGSFGRRIYIHGYDRIASELLANRTQSALGGKDAS